MTKEKAIKYLRGFKFSRIEEEDDRLNNEAVNMAIKAIQQPTIVRCKDCKNRRKWACWMYFFGHETDDNYYCADGKRKGNNE